MKMMSSHCTIPAHLTALYVFAVINLTVLLNLSLVEANVIATTTAHNRTLWEAPDKQALFGPRIPEDGVWGHLIYTTNNGCSAMDPLPSNTTEKWIAMVRRGDCPFDQKVHNAQVGGYVAAIIHNIKSDELELMGPSSKGLNIKIPSVFIGAHDAEHFRHYEKKLEDWLKLTGHFSPRFYPNPMLYLIPFIIVVGICFILMLTLMIVRWVRDMRRRQRSRLSLSNLKKIPVKKFKKGDQYDMCAICLDEYEDGEKLRILPCSHAYHQKCIDPWLTKKKRFCPICKRKVIPGEDDSDSEEDSEDETGQSENSPLLGATARNGNRGRSRGGTFDNAGLPSSMRNDVNQLSYGDDDYTSSDDDYSVSTSNYQSSVEVHQGSQPIRTVMTLADETTSGETDCLITLGGAVSDRDDHLRTPAGAVGRAEAPVLSVIDDHFSSGCINGDDEDDVSKSSLDEYKPLMEEDVVVATALPLSESPVQRDQIV